METDRDHQRLESGTDEGELTGQSGQDRESRPTGKGRQTGQETEEWLIPGVPIVRNSTPRPFSFDQPSSQEEQDQKQREQAATGQLEESASAAFPTRAPVAPPLPEEYEENADETVDMVEATPLPLSTTGLNETLPEFLWVFEYGLEMDSAVLNGPKSLDGYALLYGPAVLKGYCIAFDAIEAPDGQPLVTLVPTAEPGATVWGVLYRIPTRLMEQQDHEASSLDKLHFAVPPEPLFEAITVVVRETNRDREISCLTYVATPTALQRFSQQRGRGQRDEDAVAALASRLLTLARQHALPGEYLRELSLHAAKPTRPIGSFNGTHTTGATNPTNTTSSANAINSEEMANAAHIVNGAQAAGGTLVASPVQPLAQASREQDTEPLPVVADRKPLPVLVLPEPGEAVAMRSQTSMMAFAVYLVVMLVLVLALAVLQGLGFASTVFTASFTPLGVPWFVLVYGLLGGCASSLITLSRRSSLSGTALPGYVLVTWFTRPFIGSLLAALAYLLMNSGLLALNGNGTHAQALSSLLAALAGLTEGWIFARKR